LEGKRRFDGTWAGLTLLILAQPVFGLSREPAPLLAGLVVIAITTAAADSTSVSWRRRKACGQPHNLPHGVFSLRMCYYSLCIAAPIGGLCGSSSVRWMVAKFVNVGAWSEVAASILVDCVSSMDSWSRIFED
jgi:hypothetical protein